MNLYCLYWNYTCLFLSKSNKLFNKSFNQATNTTTRLRLLLLLIVIIMNAAVVSDIHLHCNNIRQKFVSFYSCLVYLQYTWEASLFNPVSNKPNRVKIHWELPELCCFSWPIEAWVIFRRVTVSRVAAVTGRHKHRSLRNWSSAGGMSCSSQCSSIFIHIYAWARTSSAHCCPIHSHCYVCLLPRY